MALLIFGMAIFLSVHLIPTFVGLRQRLSGWKGESIYIGCYSLVAALGLTLIIVGKATAAYVPIWDLPQWANHLTMAAMLPAVTLIAAAYIPNNLKRFVRHPFLWGVTLWALSHLLINGDFGSLILFGGFGAFALFDMWSANRRGAKKSDKKMPFYWDALLITAGAIAFSAILFLHPYLFGVPAMP
jgi:uncharacterized membrane protein